mmetsp:Transcript_35351/g.86916  ORF Transcript_35351/g.86916 Transcript_35351/m.86916 type:complete len:292 (+) Transcript_35351:188-1063(+)
MPSGLPRPARTAGQWDTAPRRSTGVARCSSVSLSRGPSAAVQVSTSFMSATRFEGHRCRAGYGPLTPATLTAHPGRAAKADQFAGAGSPIRNAPSRPAPPTFNTSLRSRGGGPWGPHDLWQGAWRSHPENYPVQSGSKVDLLVSTFWPMPVAPRSEIEGAIGLVVACTPAKCPPAHPQKPLTRNKECRSDPPPSRPPCRWPCWPCRWPAGPRTPHPRSSNRWSSPASVHRCSRLPTSKRMPAPWSTRCRRKTWASCPTPTSGSRWDAFRGFRLAATSVSARRCRSAAPTRK